MENMEKFEYKHEEGKQIENKENFDSPGNKLVINTKMKNLFNKANNLQPIKGYYFKYDESTGEGTIQAGQYRLTFNRSVAEGYTKNNGSMRSDTYRDYRNIQLTLMPDASKDNDVQGPKLIGEFKTMSDFNDITGNMEGRLDYKQRQQSINNITSTENNMESRGLNPDGQLEEKLKSLG